ncbi:hypothetical protein GGI42DRAFT_23801 [Trichoderma sp. SZMC 28013]
MSFTSCWFYIWSKFHCCSGLCLVVVVYEAFHQSAWRTRYTREYTLSLSPLGRIKTQRCVLNIPHSSYLYPRTFSAHFRLPPLETCLIISTLARGWLRVVTLMTTTKEKVGFFNTRPTNFANSHRSDMISHKTDEIQCQGPSACQARGPKTLSPKKAP